MSTAFISDLHLSDSRQDVLEEFLRFCANEALKLDALYILGDLFDLWVGDDDETPFNLTVINALKSLTNSGIRVYIMHGNRDYAMGYRFFKQTGCVPLKDPHVISIDGKRVLISHGDLLCTKDKSYQRRRKLWRNPLFLGWQMTRPLSKRKAYAQRIKNNSQKDKQKKSSVEMDVAHESVVKWMKKYKVNFLVHGHTHQSATHRFTLNNAPYQRFVLGAWTDRPDILTCYYNSRSDTLVFERMSF